MSFDFLAAIKNVAPLIAATFGTPLAGLAVKAICATLPDDQAKGVNDAHAADPVSGGLQKIAEMFAQGQISTAQIKQAEATHAERMAELGYKNAADLAKLEVDDRDSARRREEVVKDNTPAQLAWMIIGGFIAISIAQLVGLTVFADQVAKIPPQGWLLIGNISGYLANEAKQAAAYYFGSSIGSKDKDATLADIAKS